MTLSSAIDLKQQFAPIKTSIGKNTDNLHNIAKYQKAGQGVVSTVYTQMHR